MSNQTGYDVVPAPVVDAGSETAFDAPVLVGSWRAASLTSNGISNGAHNNSNLGFDWKDSDFVDVTIKKHNNWQYTKRFYAPYYGRLMVHYWDSHYHWLRGHSDPNHIEHRSYTEAAHYLQSVHAYKITEMRAQDGGKGDKGDTGNLPGGVLERLAALELTGGAQKPTGEPGGPVVPQNPNALPYEVIKTFLWRDRASWTFQVSEPGAYRIEVWGVAFSQTAADPGRVGWEILNEGKNYWYWRDELPVVLGNDQAAATLYWSGVPTGLDAGVTYAFRQTGNSLNMPDTDQIKVKFTLLKPLLVADYKDPSTWGELRANMRATTQFSERGDPLYRVDTYRDDAGFSQDIPGPEVLKGVTYKVSHHVSGGGTQRILKVGIKSDNSSASEIFTFRNDDGSAVWDFDSETTELIGDEWVHTFKADVSGTMQLEIGVTSAGDEPLYGRFHVEVVPIHATATNGAHTVTGATIVLYDVTEPSGVQINGLGLDGLGAISFGDGTTMADRVTQNADGTITISNPTEENVLLSATSGEFKVRVQE